MNFKISLASRTKVLSIRFIVELAETASLNILKVKEAEVSVTCTLKFTAPVDPLFICIYLTKSTALEGAVKTEVVSVVDKLIPAFLY